MNNIHSNLTKWSVASRIFHWVSAILLLFTWIRILLYDNLDSKVYIGLHKAFGVSLLFWMIARVISRIFNKAPPALAMPKWQMLDRKSTRLNSSHVSISYAVFCLKKKRKNI